MKLGKTLKVVSILLLASAVLAACSSNTSNSNTSSSSSVTKLDEKNLDGQYYSEADSDGRRNNLDIDGKDVLITNIWGTSKTGTIDTNKKTITVDKETADYKIIGNKLVLKLKDGDVAFTKGTPADSSNSSSTEKNETSSSKNSSSSLSTKSSSSSTTTNNAEKIYSDEHIEITKKGAIITFKNLTTQDIVVEGEAYLDDSYEINMYDFGYIGDIKANKIKTENISNLTLMNQGKDSNDKEDGETAGGDKTYSHITKSGEKISWAGTIKDSDYNDIGSVSFDITY